MENASKALLIAGAILLAILLISFGIIVIRQGSGIINNSGMSEAEVKIFNEQFAKYEGENVKGNMVKSLIQEINASNSNENNIEYQVKIEKDEKITVEKAKGEGNRQAYTYTTNLIKNADSYKVTVTDYASDGRVNQIKIEKNIK